MNVRRRELLKAITAASAATAAPAALWRAARAETRDSSPTLTELRSGLALITGAGGNVVLAATSDGPVLIDSGSAEHAQAVKALITERFGRTPPALLFNTHWHVDHTGGNDALVASGTPIVAHENTKLWMSTKFYVEWEDRHYDRRPATAVPSKTFFSSDPQPLEIPVGTSKFEYGHLPEAHTDGDIYIRLPEQNVIIAGGGLTAGRYPMLDYITGGWIGGLVDATRKLASLCDADTLIVPDAGPPQRVADLAALRAMLETVRERMEAIALQGRGVEDMLAERITKEFDERYAGDPALFISNVYEGLWWSRLRGIVA